MVPYVFISYSRADLPFAESIALEFLLNRRSVWLDYLCLMPGIDWKQGIANGVMGASAVLLLVSRASVRSLQVSDEIRQAIAADKPLILAVVEAASASLPHAPELDLGKIAHSVVDMRGNFRSSLKRLMTACALENSVRDPLPAPGLLATRLPKHVAEVLACCAILCSVFVYLTCLWTTSANFPWRAPAAWLNLAFVGLSPVWIATLALMFFRKRIARERLSSQWFLFWLLLIYEVFWQRAHVPHSPVPWWSLAIATVLTVVLLCRLFWSPDLFRWKRSQSTWYGPARKRQLQALLEQIKAVPSQQRAMLDPRPLVYSLTHSRDDAPVAETIRKTLRKAGLCEAGEPLPADNPLPPVMLRMLVVTNRLEPAKWSEFQDLPAAAKLYLLATPTRVPESVIQESSKVQWVDLRSLVPAQLGFLAGYLRGFIPSRLLYATYYLPERFESLKVPNGFPQLFLALNVLAACSLACGLFPLLFPRFKHLAPAMLPFAVVTAGWQFALAQTLYQRTRTFLWFACELSLSVLACGFLGVYRFLLVAGAVSPTLSTGVPFLFDRRYFFACAICYAVLILLSLYLLAGTWFPKSNLWKPTPGSPSFAAIAKRQIPYVLVGLLGVLYMYVNLAP